MGDDDIFMFMLLQCCNYDYVGGIEGLEGRSLWQYEWLKKRDSKFGGAFNAIMEQAREDPDQFKKSVRMNYTTFKMILNKIRTDIQKMDTNFRKCISPEMRLVITMHFLANGSSLVALKTMFKVGLLTISNIINETMKTICLNFADKINTPRNQYEWENIAREFDEI